MAVMIQRVCARSFPVVGRAGDLGLVPAADAGNRTTPADAPLMAIRTSTRPVGATRIRAVARRLLDASTLCAIATVSPGGRAHVNTAYFAWTPDLRIVWLSDPDSTHSRNVRARPSVAVAVYDSTQTWGEPDRGIQLFGRGRELGRPHRDADRAYARRFPARRTVDLAAYRLYELRPRSLKLFDERVLGSGVFVTARVGPDGAVAWDRTEVYESSL
jgi:uncharacterized protein YhbP (UPF0306 family)